MEQVLSIIYGIWNARNINIFQNKYVPPLEACNNALSLLQEFQSYGKLISLPNHSCSSSSCSNNTSWTPPLRGTLKINVDAHLSSDGHWFTGLILRRPYGSVVGAATRAHSRTYNILMGEAFGLNDALDWIEDMRLSKVTIELDSQIIVRAVKEKKTIRKGWGIAVRRCDLFLTTNPSSAIVWTKRSGNQAAHVLANWTEQEPNKIIWSNIVPSCVIPIIQKDMGYFFSD